jgi:hypothetical protein
MPTPPPVPPVADAPRTQTYAVVSTTSAIDVAFPVYGDGSDLEIFHNSVLMDPSLWTLVSKSGTSIATITQPIPDGQIQFSPSLTAGSVIINGKWRPRRVSQPTAPGIARREFNQAFSNIISSQREQHDFVISALRAVPGETPPAPLPSISDRKAGGNGTVLAFDGVTGDPTVIDIISATSSFALAAAAAAATLASQWAQLVNAYVTGSSLSAKEWALGTFKRGVASYGSAKDWATLLGATVDDAALSAKEWALGSFKRGVAGFGSAKDWAILTGATVDDAALSAKEWAVGVFKRGFAASGSSKDWANYTGGTVDDTEYSSKKYAGDASTSAASAPAGAASATTIVVEDVSTTTYTLVSGDMGKLKRFTNAAGCTITAPNNLSVGFNCVLEQHTSGTVSVAAASGATLIGDLPGAAATAFQYGTIALAVEQNSGGSSAIYLVLGRVPTADELAVSIAKMSVATVTDIAGTTYTLLSTDVGQVLAFTNAAGCAVTLPNSLPRGFFVGILQGNGAGQVSFTAASGATLRNIDGETKTAGANALCGLLVRQNTDLVSAIYVLSGRTGA